MLTLLHVRHNGLQNLGPATPSASEAGRKKNVFFPSKNEEKKRDLLSRVMNDKVCLRSTRGRRPLPHESNGCRREIVQDIEK